MIHSVIQKQVLGVVATVATVTDGTAGAVLVLVNNRPMREKIGFAKYVRRTARFEMLTPPYVIIVCIFFSLRIIFQAS